jgi:mono/diheme cytochrome c family protein
MRTLGAVLIALLAAACDSRSGVGFRLPDGDVERGRVAFAELGCNSCHRIEGADPAYVPPGAANVTLGGKTTWVKTYGELVTAIVNPSHRITPRYPADQVAIAGESLMAPAYLNDVMTVQQLIDLVAFLQSTYEVVPPPVPPHYWPVIG